MKSKQLPTTQQLSSLEAMLSSAQVALSKLGEIVAKHAMYSTPTASAGAPMHHNHNTAKTSQKGAV